MTYVFIAITVLMFLNFANDRINAETHFNQQMAKNAHLEIIDAPDLVLPTISYANANQGKPATTYTTYTHTLDVAAITVSEEPEDTELEEFIISGLAHLEASQGDAETTTGATLATMSRDQLRKLAKDLKVAKYSKMCKAELLEAVRLAVAQTTTLAY